MVDKKGKLFGKINLIDFLIVLVILAALVYVGLRFAGVVGTKQAPDQQVQVTFFANEVPNYVLDYIVPDTSVFDTTAQITIGTVQSFTSEPSIGYEQSSNGVEILPPMANTSAITLTFTVTAQYGEHGFTIGGTTYAVGNTMTIFAGQAKLYGKISGMQLLTPAA